MAMQHLLIISTHFQSTHESHLKKGVLAQSPLKPALSFPQVSVLYTDSPT